MDWWIYLFIAAIVAVALWVAVRWRTRPPEYRDEACDECLETIGTSPYHPVVDHGGVPDGDPGVQTAVASSHHARCCPGGCHP